MITFEWASQKAPKVENRNNDPSLWSSYPPRRNPREKKQEEIQESDPKINARNKSKINP